MCRTGDEVRLLIAEGSVMMCFENNGIARQLAYPGAHVKKSDLMFDNRERQY